MKFSTVCQLGLATIAAAAPTPEAAITGPTAGDLAFFEKTANQARSAGLTDTDILNFALTLEHLEKAFYLHALEKFTQADFTKAGYSARLRKNIGEIAADETEHVSFLKSALGPGAVPKCSYAFGDMTVDEFMAISGVLEGVGITAYLGAAHLISDGDYLTAAGSILTIESRHSAYIRDNQAKPQSPFPAPFDVPQSPMEVYSLASQFITSCPKAANLGFTAFPLLSVATGQKTPIRAGDIVDLTLAKGTTVKNGAFYAYFAGLAKVPAKVTGSGSAVSVTIPANVTGQSYVILSSSSTPANATDANTIAGPAILNIQSPYTYAKKD